MAPDEPVASDDENLHARQPPTFASIPRLDNTPARTARIHTRVKPLAPAAVPRGRLVELGTGIQARRFGAPASIGRVRRPAGDPVGLELEGYPEPPARVVRGPPAAKAAGSRTIGLERVRGEWS